LVATLAKRERMIDPERVAEVGRLVKEMRLARGYSMRTLAARAGVSSQTIRRIEQGTATSMLVTLVWIAKALGVELADLGAVDGHSAR
jgi:transcriptional regulator with XRE-family HTH domain